MFKTPSETTALAEDLKKRLKGVEDIDVAVFPPYLGVHQAASALKGTRIMVGVQNMHYDDNGAFTGEVSAPMVREAGAILVILGHSERRHIFGETDELINKKVRKAVAAGLRPILCIGEKIDEREAGRTETVIETQLRGSLANVTAAEMEKIVIAYEPVWAIGTGKTATPDQAESAHVYVRQVLKSMFSDKTAQATVVQYGGSVKPENIDELMACKNIDGALVGGASLKADSFERIVKYKR
jgi:triosephosphate isomerase